MSPPIAIIGAGESGLTLARLLEVNNVEYVVFEQNPASVDMGFWGTLDIHSDTAQVVLKEAGLFEKFKDLARFETQVSAIFDHHGEILTRSDIEDLPQIDWHDLRALLVESIPPEKIRWKSRVRELQQESDGSTSVHLEDGNVEKDFRLVVGADGIWSKVRPMITHESPRYFGVTYLRTSISPESTFWTTVAGQLRPTNYMALGHGKSIAAQRNVAGTYTVFIGLPVPENWNDHEALDPPVFRNKLERKEFEHWGARVLNWLRHSDGHFTISPLYSMSTDSLSWNTVPGVAVVGDAAHPSTPWTNESMGCAMYDSLQLTQSIVKHGVDHLDAAVAEYEELMFPRAIDLIQKSTEIGNVFFAKDAVDLIQAMMMEG